MNKRGQFFLIAAVVVIGVLLGMSVIYNTTNAPREDTKIYDLSEKFYHEGSQVIDFNIIKQQNDSDLQNYLRRLVDDSSSQLESGSQIIIIYGDRLNGLYYNTCDPTGRIDAGGSGSNLCSGAFLPVIAKVNDIDSNKIDVKYGNSTYSFDVKQGQQFYMLLKTTETTIGE